MHITKTTIGNIAPYIRTRQDFDANGAVMRGLGAPLWPDPIDTGMLPAEFRDKLIQDCVEPDFYVVFSRNTVIGWFAAGVWTIPPVRYDSQTNRHQAQLWLAVTQ